MQVRNNMKVHKWWQNYILGVLSFTFIRLEDNTWYISRYTETWWIAIIIIFHLTHQTSLMIVACNTFQSWVARQAPWQMIIVNHTHYTQMFNCANGILKSTFWLLGSPEKLFISKAKKREKKNTSVQLWCHTWSMDTEGTISRWEVCAKGIKKSYIHSVVQPFIYMSESLA